MSTMAERSIRGEEEISAVPFGQLLNDYVDEIFADYRESKATLSEVLDEIKGIIGVLIADRTDHVFSRVKVSAG